MSTASAELSRSAASFAAAAAYISRTVSAGDRTKLQQMPLSANAVALEGLTWH